MLVRLGAEVGVDHSKRFCLLKSKADIGEGAVVLVSMTVLVCSLWHATAVKGS